MTPLARARLMACLRICFHLAVPVRDEAMRLLVVPCVDVAFDVEVVCVCESVLVAASVVVEGEGLCLGLS